MIFFRIALLSILLMATSAVAADGCSVRSGATIVPLVELYTSEGCSSCPPADRWLSRRSGEDGANWLAFHVDYWDDIGWPDRFASPEYSQRQRRRVGAAGDTTVYTPQVMVGADVRASWRSDAGFARVLQKARQPADTGLALRLREDKDGWRLQLGAARTDAGSPAPAQVWLAQYVDDQVTDVRAGENRGVTLRHDRVVRKLWGPWPLGADALSRTVDLKPDTGAWGVVAFVQDAGGRTLQSLALPAKACNASH